MMKIKRKKILWIRLLVYSLAMGAGTFLVHQKWDEQARTTFKTALLQEKALSRKMARITTP